MADLSLTPPKKRRKKFLIWFGAVFLFIALLILLVPTILSTNWAKSLVESKASKNSGMKVTMEKLSVGWWSPAEIQKLRVVGNDAFQELTVDRIQADFSAFGYLFGKSSLSVLVENPVIVAVRKAEMPRDSAARPSPEKSGDSLKKPEQAETQEAPEDEETPAPKRKKPLAIPFDDLQFELRGGRIQMRDEVLGTQTSLENLQISMSSHSKKGPLDLKASTSLGSSAGGKFLCEGRIDLAKPSGKLIVELDEIDFAAYQALVAKQLDVLRGKLQGKLEMQFEGTSQFQLNGKIQAQGIALKGAATNHETIEEKEITIEPKLSANLDEGKFEAEGFKLLCSFASMEGKGSVGTTGTGSASIQTRIDLQKLPLALRAKMPPKFANATLITSDMVIRSKEGKLPVELKMEIAGLAQPVHAEAQAVLDPDNKEFNLALAKFTVGEIVATAQARIEYGQMPPKLESKGELHMALQEISNWSDSLPKEMKISGDETFNFQVKGNLERIEGSFRSELKQLRVSGGKLTKEIVMDSPVQLDGQFVQDNKQSAFELSQYRLVVEDMVLSGKLDCHFGGAELALNAESNLKAQLASLQKWIPNLPPDLQLSGQIDSRVAFDGGVQKGKGAFVTRIEGLKAVRSSLPQPYEEKSLTLELAGIGFDLTQGQATVDKLNVDTESKVLNASGKLSCSESFQKLHAELSFKMKSDPMMPLLSSLLPKDLVIKGDGEGSLKVDGRWAEKDAKDIQLTANMSFPEISYTDTVCKNGTVQIATQGKTIQIQKLEAEVNGKPVRASGTIDMAPQNPVIDLTASCEQVPVKQSFLLPLSYAIPILASADNRQMKLDSNIDGNMKIHGEGLAWAELKKNLTGEGKFSLGAGSLMGPSALKMILAGTNGAVKFEGLDAPFAIKDGKIQSPGLTLKMKDSSVSMKGFTTLDGEMSYDVHVNLPPSMKEQKWGKNFEELFGKSGLPVGLAGTVTSPKPSFKMPDLQNVGEELLKDKLDDLLKKKKKKN